MLTPSKPWIPVAQANELPPGSSRKFYLEVAGHEEECFVVNFEGNFYAYVNRCRHVPMSLDWVDNQFFTSDGRFLQCATHGARYLPQTGECVSGPPCGKFLRKLEVRLLDGLIYVAADSRTDAEPIGLEG